MTYDEADDMCPNCVTPWKCNGPHLHEQTKAYRDNPPDAAPSPALTREALQKAGFEPDFNVCGRCKHHGGEHDLGNWCLVCPRPEMPARPIEARLAAGWCYFSSMTEDEKWAHGLAALGTPPPAPTSTREETP